MYIDIYLNYARDDGSSYEDKIIWGIKQLVGSCWFTPCLVSCIYNSITLSRMHKWGK